MTFSVYRRRTYHYLVFHCTVSSRCFGTSVLVIVESRVHHSTHCATGSTPVWSQRSAHCQAVNTRQRGDEWVIESRLVSKGDMARFRKGKGYRSILVRSGSAGYLSYGSSRSSAVRRRGLNLEREVESYAGDCSLTGGQTWVHFSRYPLTNETRRASILACNRWAAS